MMTKAVHYAVGLTLIACTLQGCDSGASSTSTNTMTFLLTQGTADDAAACRLPAVAGADELDMDADGSRWHWTRSPDGMIGHACRTEADGSISAWVMAGNGRPATHRLRVISGQSTVFASVPRQAVP